MSVRYYDWIAHFGRRTPDKIAVIDLGSSRRLSYAQFDARISRLATHLRVRLNVARGDRVAVLASMHLEATASQGATEAALYAHVRTSSTHCT